MLSEYNEALHIATEKKISYDEGFEAGVKQARQNIEQERQRTDAVTQNAAQTLISICQEVGLDKEAALSKLCSGLNIDKTIAQSLIDKYWTFWLPKI